MIGESGPELAVKPGVRSLRQDDARGIAMLVADVFAELGLRPAMSIEQTEKLFATPWLENGVGLVLEYGSEMAGYGFARPTRWKGTDSIQLGLTLRRGYRDRESHRFLTDRLLDVASELAARYEIHTISVHLRSTDTVHPPVMIELGFREHAVSMLGFRHDLTEIPPHPLPSGFAFRPVRLPDEVSTVLSLSGAAFDDRDRQGEPMNETYLSLVAGKTGFDPEQMLLVENAGSPIAYIVVDATSYGVGIRHNILELGVLPRSRNLGVGSALVCRVLGWSKARGASEALTGMFSTNLAATLYMRLGFRPDPRLTFRFFVRDVTPPPSPEPVEA